MCIKYLNYNTNFEGLYYIQRYNMSEFIQFKANFP